MDRKTCFALISGMTIVLALALLVTCGTPEPSPEVIQPAATSAPATAVPTQPIATSAPTIAVSTEVPTTSPAKPAISIATRHALFIQAWMLINDRYVYPDYGGLDWEAVRDEYTEKIANAASDEEFYALMREMVDLLGDDHSHFLSPDIVALQDAIYENLEVPGGIGASLGEVDGELFIEGVFPDGPAFKAGVRLGERIVAVDGVPWERFSSFDEVRLAIIGESGTEVVLTVRSFDDVEREVPITRAVIDLESALVQVKAIEDGKIGLLTLGGFDSPRIAELVRERLSDLMSEGTLDGLIVDVRANSGGDIDTLLDTLSLFVDGGSIGSQAGKKEAVDLLIPEGKRLPELEGLPVAVLTGPHTISAGELFAAGMQIHGRATIVGLPSAGNTELISGHALSDGSVLSIAEWVYQLPDGTLIEGRGVQPDRMVDMDWALYGTDKDPQIQAAIEVLASE